MAASAAAGATNLAEAAAFDPQAHGQRHRMTLGQIAWEIECRLVSVFIADRPCHGLGASYQTGWTALITRCFHYLMERR